MRELNRQIVSGLVAAICLAIMSMWTEYLFWFNVGISAGVGLGTYFTIPLRRDPCEIELAPGVTQAHVDAAVAVIEAYIGKYSDMLRRCSDPAIKTAIREMMDTLKKIARNFQEDPGDLNLMNAPRFLDQYLVRSFDVVSQYVRLSNKTLDQRGEEQMAGARENIRQIEAGFVDFYQECLQNDLMNLEVDSETLKAIIDIDSSRP